MVKVAAGKENDGQEGENGKGDDLHDYTRYGEIVPQVEGRLIVVCS